MELLLNLAWILVAGGLTVFLLRHRSTPRHSWPAVLGAALFIAVLLFPAISASDDLHSDLFLIDDASRRTLSLLGTHSDVVPTVALLSPPPCSLCSGGLLYAGIVVESRPPTFLPSSIRPALGLRAPPAHPSLALLHLAA